MPHIELPEGVPGIGSGFMFRPETAKPMRELAEVLLRGDNTLSRGERELIAAYVSNLNDCMFCQASHSSFAALQLEGGMAVVEQVKCDPASAPISDKLRALLAIAARVQQSGKLVTHGGRRGSARRGRHRRRDSRHGADRGCVLDVQPLRRRPGDVHADRSRAVRRDGSGNRRERVRAPVTACTESRHPLAAKLTQTSAIRSAAQPPPSWISMPSRIIALRGWLLRSEHPAGKRLPALESGQSRQGSWCL